ncbi:MAG TPA: HAMP domain-containing sensor histidine kinase, partial [Thermoanaerobaculia bacterium]|nr:HAMP domain-containing sensor histidine kinase [Thermoanaerobaculia bacterium]
VFAVALARRLEGRRRYAVSFALLLAPSLFGFLLLTGARIAPPVVVLTAAAAAAFAWTTAREALGTLRHGRSAARVLESQLGIAPATAEPGLRLEELALLLARRRVEETEAKRVLAHELKTPLASMKSLAQLLREFPLTEAETRRVASLLHGETEKLQSMVERLLELERLALLDFDSEAATLDLGELVARRVEFLRAGTDRALVADVDRAPVVRGNKALLERALDNLVGNSIRYAPPPAPILVRVFGGGEGALLEVEDRGPGIPAGEREIVLRRFARGTSARGKDGLGLGLALVAEVARWHRGTVEIDEAPAGGAIVRLRFPLAAEAQRKEAV